MIFIMKLLLSKLLDTCHKFRHEYGVPLFSIRRCSRSFRWYFPCILFL